MYDEAVPVLERNLRAMSAVLDKAEAHCAEAGIEPDTILNFKLAPDMWPFYRQVQAAADHCRRLVQRFTEETPSDLPEVEVSFDGLRARISLALDALAAADPESFRRAEALRIVFPAGPVTFDWSGPEYLRKFIVPNVYFHYTVAYAMLRHSGMPIEKLNKFDFVGQV